MTPLPLLPARIPQRVGGVDGVNRLINIEKDIKCRSI